MSDTKRRQYGTGSVYFNASKERWYGTTEAGFTPSGARRRVSVTAATEAECRRKLRDKQTSITRAGRAAKQTRSTVRSWSETWLEHKATEVRPKTLAAYTSAVRRWIVPTLGGVRLDSLTADDRHALAEAQRKAGRSSTNTRHTDAVLLVMLRDAAAKDHPVPSGILAARRPNVAVNDRAAIPTADAIRLLQTAAGLPHGSRWAAALLQGMRQGECLGLTWEAVDLDKSTLTISWQLQSLTYADRETGRFVIPDGYDARQLVGGLHLVRPKSRKGWRVIPLVPWMRDALADWQAIAQPSPHGLVWPNLNGGPANVKRDLDEWKALQCTADVGHPAGRYYVLHEARHATATLLMEARIDGEVIKAILGHSSIVVSRGYMHVEQEQSRRAMEKIAERLQLTSSG